MQNIGITLSAPTSIELTLTKKCNHKCLHCYNPWREEINCEESGFSYEQLEIIVDELKKNDVWHVTLSGGEPLMQKDDVVHISKLLMKAGITFSMNTNLTLMTDEFAKKLKEELNWNTLILTSLPSIYPDICDSITQINGSYQKILNGIKICKDNGFQVGINIVISQKNLLDLDNIEEFISKNRIDYLCVSIVIPPTYDSENPDYYLNNNDIVRLADALIAIKKKYNVDVDSITPLPICILKDINKYKDIISTTCSAGLTRCTIDTDGNIFACSHEDTPYGNIFVDGLKSAWDKMGSWREIEKINPECENCNYLAICGGECRMMKNGDNKYYCLDKDADISYSPVTTNLLIDDSSSFCINKDINIKIRKEEFGAAIRVGYNEYYISDECLEFYNYLRKIEKFKVDELKKMVDDYDTLIETLTYFESISLIDLEL